MQNAECRMQNAEWKMENEKWKVEVIFLPMVEKCLLKCFSSEMRKATLTFCEAKYFTKAKPSFHTPKAYFTCRRHISLQTRSGCFFSQRQHSQNAQSYKGGYKNIHVWQKRRCSVAVRYGFRIFQNRLTYVWP